MKSTDFLKAAEDLLRGPRKPKQANLRGAFSTTYYPLFHTICHCCANTMVSNRTTRRAWTPAYRSLNHAHAKSQCLKARVMNQFPADIQDFANVFVQMQERPRRADYDPNGIYCKSAVKADIDAARVAIEAFETADLKHGKAFAIYVVFEGPRG